MDTLVAEDTGFQSFAKIARLNRECVVTEKIDGTNSHVMITEAGQVLAGSRNRYLTLTNDNYGFARWVSEHEDELRALGPGRHYGEWWGSGIQRKYGLTGGDKRFSLFNVARWEDPAVRPACCSVVPVLYRGAFDTTTINHWLIGLKMGGSKAAPGFMNAEGIVIWHEAARQMFKATIEKDEQPKGLAA